MNAVVGNPTRTCGEYNPKTERYSTRGEWRFQNIFSVSTSWIPSAAAGRPNELIKERLEKRDCFNSGVSYGNVFLEYAHLGENNDMKQIVYNAGATERTYREGVISRTEKRKYTLEAIELSCPEIIKECQKRQYLSCSFVQDPSE